MSDLFTNDNKRRMFELERELAIVLRRANDQKLEAGVAAFALARLARLLLDKYPDATRTALVDVIAAFLRREPPPADAEAGASLLLQ